MKSLETWDSGRKGRDECVPLFHRFQRGSRVSRPPGLEGQPRGTPFSNYILCKVRILSEGNPCTLHRVSWHIPSSCKLQLTTNEYIDVVHDRALKSKPRGDNRSFSVARTPFSTSQDLIGDKEIVSCNLNLNDNITITLYKSLLNPQVSIQVYKILS